MGLYEDKLHDFLTVPENFDLAWEIYEAIPMVRDRLKAELLDAFQPYAEEQVEGTCWTCARFSEDRVGISKDAWGEMFNINLYLGARYLPGLSVWHDKSHRLLKGQRERLAKSTGGAAGKFKGMSNGANSLWYYRLGTNFETHAELRALLPDNRSGLMEDYWQQLWKIAQAFESNLDEIVRSLKNQSA